MRFGLKRKKENEFSFYVTHPNQLFSEVLFTTAGLFLKNFANLRVLGGSALKYTALGSVCLVYFGAPSKLNITNKMKGVCIMK